MRHGKAHRKFSRTPAHRRAMFRNMATSLLQHERVETTIHKAKDLRPVAEKIISLGCEDSLHNRRQALSYLKSKEMVHKLFAEIGPRFKERPGGYTRITRTRIRNGDAAEMAVIELVQEDLKPAKKKKKKASAPKKKAAAKKADAKPKAEKAAKESTEDAAEAAAEEAPKSSEEAALAETAEAAPEEASSEEEPAEEEGEKKE